MKNKEMKIIILLVFISLIIPTVCAKLSVWHNNPKTGTDTGEIFDLRFEIFADKTTNYTINIEPGIEFSSIDGNNSMTIEIPKNSTRTFIFNLRVEEELDDGKYPIKFSALKEGVVFKTGNAYIRAGVQAPGFELIIILISVALIFVWKKRV